MQNLGRSIIILSLLASAEITPPNMITMMILHTYYFPIQSIKKETTTCIFIYTHLMIGCLRSDLGPALGTGTNDRFGYRDRIVFCCDRATLYVVLDSLGPVRRPLGTAHAGPPPPARASSPPSCSGRVERGRRVAGCGDGVGRSHCR
jgi:hypothetical protein